MQDHISKNKPFLWTQFHLEMHSISNFPPSFDHFEGGMEDFLNQERKRILHTPSLPRKSLIVSHVYSKISQPGLVYKLQTQPQCTCIYSGRSRGRSHRIQ